METLKTYNRVVAVGVDMQNDFAPGGALGVNEGDQVVPAFNQAGQWVRNKNGIVVFTRDQHPKETKHFAEWGGPWPPHCVVGTKGAEFILGLDVREGDPIINKGTNPVDDGYSGFEGQTHDEAGLDVVVHPTHGEKVAMVVGGLATDYCDLATVMDGLEFAKNLDESRELGVFVLRDAVRAVDLQPGDGDRALAQMQEAGAVVISLDDLVNDRAFKVEA